MSEMALKGCPFCGGKATMEKVQVHSFDVVRYSVGCEEQDGKAMCHGYQSLTTWARKLDAAKAWNTRHMPPTLRPAIETILAEEVTCGHAGAATAISYGASVERLIALLGR